MEYNMKVKHIDKELILSHATEAQIFEYYLGVTVDLRDGNSPMFTSPIRPDRRPTCKFYITTWGALYFHDFNGYFTGDCFALVMMLFNASYGEALNYIAKDLQIVDDKNIIQPGRKTLTFTARSAQPKKYSKLGITRREWNEHDKDYWQPYEISSVVLEKFNVFPVQKVYLKNKQNYNYSIEDPAYAYYFGNQKFKIYFPLRKIFRFLLNTDILQGYQQLPPTGRLLIITKALKDVMDLDILGYSAVAPQGETVAISTVVMEELKSRFDQIITLYDPDDAGVIGAEKVQDEHDLPFVTIPAHLGIKDISDFIKERGLQEADDLMHELLDRPFT